MFLINKKQISVNNTRCPIIVHKINVQKKYLYIYARGNFVNKYKNTFVSDNSPFAGKRMGRHINFKRQYQTAFINIIIKNLWSENLMLAVVVRVSEWVRVYVRVWVRVWLGYGLGNGLGYGLGYRLGYQLEYGLGLGLGYWLKVMG